MVIARQEPEEFHLVPNASQSSKRARYLLSNSYAENTRKMYRSLFQQFDRWCEINGYSSLPATHETLSEFIAYYSIDHAAGTVRGALNAIKCIHKEVGLSSPTDHADIKKMMRGLARDSRGNAQKQAAELSMVALKAIRLTALNPRKGRGGRFETGETAKSRGLIDIALCSVMFDALLRRSEAVEMRWDHIEYGSDSATGVLFIPYSKTDQVGDGAFQFLSRETMNSIERIKPNKPFDISARVFNMSGETISRRIKNAAEAAGLEGNFSGHSWRVGMATELARSKQPLHMIMQAGRWKSHNMPAKYIRKIQVGQSAVAAMLLDE